MEAGGGIEAVEARARDRRNARFGRLYEELGRPARGMVRRAFGQAFTDDEIDDLYSGAWLGTMRALERRHEELSDLELRRYVLSAVANQASRELRRRGRRPTAPIEAASLVPDSADLPDQLATRAENDRLTRDVLASLPQRRRAVMMFRYGLELAPEEVCEAVDGLSPRAYRKEVNRGVKEVADKLRMVEAGEWCEERAPLLQAFASGTADGEERRQAERHLAHCRPCAAYVGELGGRLHELGSALAVGTAMGTAVAGSPGIGERLGASLERARELVLNLVGRVGDAAEPVAANVAGTGAAGSAGAAGVAGAMAKLGAIGTAGKTLAACLAVGAAATTCVATGVLPTTGEEQRPAESEGKQGPGGTEKEGEEIDATEPPPAPPPAGIYEGASTPEPSPPSTQGGSSSPEDGSDEADGQGHGQAEERDEQSAPEPSPEVQEFAPVGEPVAPAPPPPPPPAPAPPPSTGGSSGGGSSGGGGGSTGSDFGP